MYKKLVAVIAIASLAHVSAASAQAGRSWMRGPGTHSFKVCAKAVAVHEAANQHDLHVARPDGGKDGTQPVSDHDRKATRAEMATRGRGGEAQSAKDGCDVTVLPGRPVTLTVEAWGGGGGGGHGGEGKKKVLAGHGGAGGGGGGGGGYGKAIVTATVSSGSITYDVSVGSGGGGAGTGGIGNPSTGQPGTVSSVRRNGVLVVQGAAGSGGGNGSSGSTSSNPATGGPGGNAGGGTPGGLSGTNGLAGNNVTATTPAGRCLGTDGGLGGAGGGPGRTGPGYVNDGGNGGNGGYTNRGVICNTRSANWGWQPGTAGGNGQVKISW